MAKPKGAGTIGKPLLASVEAKHYSLMRSNGDVSQQKISPIK